MPLGVGLYKARKFDYQQPGFDHMPKVPLRGVLLGPSGAGKTQCIVDMVLDKDKYRGRFARIWVFSPSCLLDPAWESMRRYIYGARPVGLGVDPSEQCMFDH